MPGKTHFSVRLPEPDLAWLENEADRLGLSIAELLRRIVAEYRREQENR